MESNTAFNPGEKFFYNSMNSYMLSAIIKEKTKKSVTELLDILNASALFVIPDTPFPFFLSTFLAETFHL